MQTQSSHSASTRLDREAYARLKAIAKVEHRTVANLMSKIVNEWLKTQPVVKLNGAHKDHQADKRA